MSEMADGVRIRRGCAGRPAVGKVLRCARRRSDGTGSNNEEADAEMVTIVARRERRRVKVMVEFGGYVQKTN